MNGKRGILPGAPEVGAQFPARDGLVGGVMNQDADHGPARVNPVFINRIDSPVNGIQGNPAGHGKGLVAESKGEKMGFPHALQFHTNWEESKGLISDLCEIAKIVKIAQPCRVSRQRKRPENDVWPQRIDVMDAIDALIASGVPAEDLAKDFGLETTSSIDRGWRYNYDRIPHMNTCVLIARRLGWPLKKVRDPMPEDSETPESDEMALARAYTLGAMGSEVMAQLTDEQILRGYRTAVASTKAYLAP